MTTDSTPANPPDPDRPGGLPDQRAESDPAANATQASRGPADDAAGDVAEEARQSTESMPSEQPTEPTPDGASFGTLPPAHGTLGGAGRSAPRPAVPRLQRSSSDKVLTGVCGGLSRHTGVDAILFRIGFVALVMAGGVGILLYIALAVLMPRDDGQQIWSRAGGLPQFMPADPSAPDIRIGDREREQTVGYLGAALREGRLDLTEYDERVATAYQAKLASELRELVADLRLATALDHPGPGYGTPAPPALPKGPRSPVPGVTLAILLIGLGLVALGDRYGNWSLEPSTYFGIAVAAIGVALLVSAFGPWRRSKAGLITLGLMLSLGLFVTTAVDERGGFDRTAFSEQTYRPLTTDDIQPAYRVLMGESTLDLSRVDFSSGDPTEIDIEVTMGNFEILLPREAAIRYNGETSFGSVSIFGFGDLPDGFYHSGEGAGAAADEDNPDIILNVDVQFGNAAVRRVG